MMKKIYLILVILLTVGILFSGCTQGSDATDLNDEEKVIISNADEANQTLNEASVDITGIGNTLSEIDDILE